MNHSRDDNGMGATSRRAVTSGGAFQTQVPPGNAQNQAQAASQAPSQPQSTSQGGIRRSTLTTNDALVYLREVKQRFQGRKDVYDSFLDVMKDFKAMRIDISTVIRKVKELLQGHNDLILGFNTFLPRGSEIGIPPERREAKPAVELDQAITYINKIKARFANDERVYKNFLEILCCFRQGRMDIHAVYREVAELFHSHGDLLEEFGYFLPDHSQEGAAAQELLNTSARAMGAPLSSQSNTIDGTGDVVPPRRRSSRAGGLQGRGAGSREQMDYERELRFFSEVKSKLNNRETYTDLLKCVNLYAQDVISKSELVDLVQDLIGKYPEVMATFRQFVGCSSSGRDDDMLGDDGGPGREGQRVGLAQTQRNRALVAQRNKYLTRPVSELDTTTLERPTTSYVRLPKDYPIMKCSGRTAASDAVLQDDLASVTTGTEDSSFKHMRKNQYEENLFRCEDERYDLEMAIEKNASTVKALRPIQDELARMTQEEKAGYALPNGVLNPVHCRMIERVYGDKGKNVVELLKKNPAIAVSVVLSRLQQKDQEWQSVRETMNAHWAAVYQANYHKSLDHRSFYFKQSDKKNLAPKQLLLEIKEAADKLKKEDQRLRNLTTYTSLASNIQAHLTMDYSDQSVHEDVYQVVKFAASKMLSTEAYKQAMEFWGTFVEPFFGITPHEVEAAQSVSAQEEDIPMGDEEQEENVEGDEEDVKMDPSGTLLGPPTPPGAKKRDAEGESGKDSPDSLPVAAEPADDVMDEDQRDFDDDPKAASSDRQSEPSRLFGGCQPLVAVMHKSTIDQENGADDPCTSGDASALFYCNEPFYIFFRLHHYLFDRLWMARKCSRSQERVGNPGTGRETGPMSQMEEGDESSEKVHAQFMSMVYQLIDGAMEMSQFEDLCRSLLSTNSYVLFTLDKLIFRMIKHIQALVQDEISLRIWDMYKYEQSRLARREELYLSNCKVVLREDQMFRVERTLQNHLTIQIMSHEFMTEMGWHSLLKPSFSEYYKRFLGSTGEETLTVYEGFTPVLLRRNLPAIPRDDGGKAEAEHLSEYYIRNGLEGRMHCDTSKLAYVLGSEDLLVRKKRKRSAEAVELSRNRRAKNFEAWLDTRVAPQVTTRPLNSVWQSSMGPGFHSHHSHN